MKFTKKLWKSFLDKRIYGWDLIKIIDEKEIKVFRDINSISSDKFIDDDNSEQNIPNSHSCSVLQINFYLKKLNRLDAFLKAREICRNHKEFKMDLGYKFKELR